MRGEFLLRKPSAAPQPLPAAYRDLLKRKQGVNLYISGGRVVWQFAYNEPVINAIKTVIKGRKWEKDIPPKGCWTCPIESLADAIRLYEFMGRTADAGLKARAKKLDASLADAIKLTAHLLTDGSRPGGAGAPTGAPTASEAIGRVVCAFEYDADVVSSIKQLAPTQRSYDPSTREWPVDLLALPELLEHLSVYQPSPALAALARACEAISRLIDAPAAPPPPVAAASTASMVLDDEDDAALAALDIDAIVASQASQHASQQAGTSQGGSQGEASPHDDDVAIDGERTRAERDAEGRQHAIDVDALSEPRALPIETKPHVPPPAGHVPPPAGSSSAAAPADVRAQLKAELQRLQQLVQSGDGPATVAVDRSDCGEAKRRKLTTKHRSDYSGGWDDEALLTGRGCSFFDDDSDESDDLGGSFAGGLAARLSRRLPPRAPSSCGCGQPWKLVGGRHVCRYFGFFRCGGGGGGGCGNRWTSAYCWDGERQACRACNTESLPYKREKLDGRAGMGNGKPHDSARCSMCAELGYDCSR